MLSGRSISGTEAAAIGLVDRVVDEDVVGFALGYAAQLAAFPRSALEALLQCADAADGATQNGFDVEEREIVRMMAEGEGPEGLRAFLEKRPPVFG
jgi:enoyl-CoA hydratase